MGVQLTSGHPGLEKIRTVETIRGLAALAVCLFHFSKSNVSWLGSAAWYPKIVAHGWLGVEAFFVLSGFIIPYAMIRGGYARADFPRFFAKRCLRIEPPYLASIVLVLFLNLISAQVPGYQGAPFSLDWGQLLTHVAYLPEHFGYTWLIDVYWSLEAEFHYYIIIGLVLPFIWRSRLNLGAGMLIGLLLSFFVKLYVFSYAPLFVMGIATCAYRLGKIDRNFFWALLGLAVAASLVRGQDFRMPLVGLLTALAIVYIDYASPITAFLGKISYSLYLVHIPLGSRFLNLGGRYADNDWKVWLLLLSTLGITLLASWFFYRAIELPAQLLSKKLRYQRT